MLGAWLCRLSPLPWLAGIALFVRAKKRGDSLGAALCLAACFLSLAAGVVGAFALLRAHSSRADLDSRPPRDALILGAIGILGGIVAAMTSVLLSDLAE
jgi:hypothetical protein